ncbi:MAG: Large extracellular alpha-helical protein [Microgenomates group bacterium GW2011_GWF2_45_18]|nr:MAG: Large extracellular alpha-helical protein [Microgenomates group bacterium GW2011_GWF2_45_18]
MQSFRRFFSSIHALFTPRSWKFLLLFSVGLIVLFFIPPTQTPNESEDSENNSYSVPNPSAEQPKAPSPWLSISKSSADGVGGGVFSLAPSDPSEVKIKGKLVLDSDVRISVFAISERDLLEFLRYKETENGKQVQTSRELNTTGKEQLASFQFSEFSWNSNREDQAVVSLPLEKEGMYLVDVEAQKDASHAQAIVLRTSLGVIAKEGKGEFVIWAQDLNTGMSIQDASLSVYALQNTYREISSATVNTDGVATTPIHADADIALVRSAGRVALLPLQLSSLNSWNYNAFEDYDNASKFYFFTDRPIYQPGDKVYFKAFVRNDDDARYTIPSGVATVTLQDGYGEEDAIETQKISLSPTGSIDGSFVLPTEIDTEYFYLQLLVNGESTSASFTVAAYRKPEYLVEISRKTDTFVKGEPVLFSVKGSYFSGEPLADVNVAYTVKASDLGYISHLSGTQNPDLYRYYGWDDKTLKEGEVLLDKNGNGVIELDTTAYSDMRHHSLVTATVSYKDSSGNMTSDAVNAFMLASSFVLERTDHVWVVQKNAPTTLTFQLHPLRSDSVQDTPVEITMERTSWISKPSPDSTRTIYEQDKESYEKQTVYADAQGVFSVSVPTEKEGNYKIQVSYEDKKQNIASQEFSLHVSRNSYASMYEYTPPSVQISLDKEKYEVGETANILITSDEKTQTHQMLLSYERGRVSRWRVVTIENGQAEIQEQILEDDAPNIYARAVRLNQDTLIDSTQEILVSTETKNMIVKLTPDKEVYGPGETATIQVSTTDGKGNPVSAETAVWFVDKALFQLASSNRYDTIFERFWRKRYLDTIQRHSMENLGSYGAERGGGCFVADTQVRMADGSTKVIQNIRSGDTILTRNEFGKTIKAKVNGTHKVEVDGVFVINGTLSLTPEHVLRVNDLWQEATYMQIGDMLTAEDGSEVEVRSIEWLKKPQTVYNLSVAKEQTFFANGFWVHNQKGDGAREVFKDVAYWNPAVRTDDSGRASISVLLPDNLTTWVISGIGATTQTAVGESYEEVRVTKAVVVRPILPNLLRKGDTAQISAYVQNHTDNDISGFITLQEESAKGTSKKAFSIESATQPFSIQAGGRKEIFWTVKVEEMVEQAKLSFSATKELGVNANSNDQTYDRIILPLKTDLSGFYTKRVLWGTGDSAFQTQLQDSEKNSRTTLKLDLSASLTSSLVSSFDYLIEYPYGCMEQITSRFVPALVAKQHQTLFGEVVREKDLDEMIQTGVTLLEKKQNYDGGWSWYQGTTSEPFLTAYVAEHLVLADQLGADVQSSTLENIKRFATNDTKVSPEGRVLRAYTQSLLKLPAEKISVEDMKPLSSDLIALTVISNIRQGETDPEKNGANYLLSIAREESTGRFTWSSGSDLHFGSSDASTALAVRALMEAGVGETQQASAIRALAQSRTHAYWSNTFATAQVLKTIAQFSTEMQESFSPFSATVSLGENAKTYSFSSPSVAHQFSWSGDDADFPESLSVSSKQTDATQSDSSNKLYSYYEQSAFSEARSSEARSNGLEVTREYVSEKGVEYTPAVGDEVTINLTVSTKSNKGDASEYRYAVLRDYLPAGMVPINESLKNEQNASYSSYRNYRLSNQTHHDDGVEFSLYFIGGKSQTYSYRARVVSAGTFFAPPAELSLMYAPELFAQTRGEEVIITTVAEKKPESATEKVQRQVKAIDLKKSLLITAFILGVPALVFVWKKRRRG